MELSCCEWLYEQCCSLPFWLFPPRTMSFMALLLACLYLSHLLCASLLSSTTHSLERLASVLLYSVSSFDQSPLNYSSRCALFVWSVCHDLQLKWMILMLIGAYRMFMFNLLIIRAKQKSVIPALPAVCLVRCLRLFISLLLFCSAVARQFHKSVAILIPYYLHIYHMHTYVFVVPFDYYWLFLDCLGFGGLPHCVSPHPHCALHCLLRLFSAAFLVAV